MTKFDHSAARTLVQQMTLQEKAALLTGGSAWTTAALERLGIPAMVMADGPHGIRKVPDVNSIGGRSLPATCFPTASLLACTWDEALLHEVGAAIGGEAQALGVHVVLGPANNMKRAPQCGRNFEYFSEDPYLSGVMSSAFIEGVQSRGVGTSLKHFAVNNQESQRFNVDAQLDERTLREIYLAAFEMAVTRAKPWTVMCAYNRVNGERCAEHHYLLNDILKTEWGFSGLVMSDWGAVNDRARSVAGGLDLEMPGPRPDRVQQVIDAVQHGTLTEQQVDAAATRVVAVVMHAVGATDPVEFDAEQHHRLARRAAAGGMVLLKNNGMLPLRTPARIAVIGRSAVRPLFQGGGSSRINARQVDSPIELLKARAGAAEVTYCDGYPEDDSQDDALIEQAVSAARAAEVALLFVALPSFKESEGYDRDDLDLTAHQVRLIRAVAAAQPNCTVILNNGAALTVGAWINDVGAVLEGWMMGQAGAGAVVDLLFGDACPSGRLAESFPLQLAHTPAVGNFPGEQGHVRYGEGLFIGYRYYDQKQLPVQFPFGFGLSYTQFTWLNARLSATRVRDVDGLTVTVDITNSGSLAGAEVVQIYVHDIHASLIRPIKELKGFAKVTLNPGETRTVSVQLDYRAFAFYHPGHRRWVTESGAMQILVAASAADIRATLTVDLISTGELPSLLQRESTVGDWLADARGRAVLMKSMPDFAASFGVAATPGGADAASSRQRAGMDMQRFLADIPLGVVIGFQRLAPGKSPDVLVGELLAQLNE